MENQANTKNLILTLGLYLGIVGVISHLALWATGNIFELQWLNSVISLIAMVAFIVFGIKKFKETSNGYISWGKGVKIGLGITMVSAIITVIYILLFTNVIAPDFQQQALEVQQQKWLDGGMSQEQIDTALEMTKKFQTPAISSAMMLAFSAFIGFVISAIIAAIMKKSEENQ